MKGCYGALEPTARSAVCKALTRLARCWEFESWWCHLNISTFLLHCFFLSLSRNHIPKSSVCLSVSCVKKKSSGDFNHSFISIAFELSYVCEGKARRLSLNRIAKEET